MSLGAHLLEFRKRLMLSAAGLLVGMIVAFIVTDPIIAFISEPINRVAEESDQLVALTFNSVTAPFDLRMRMAFSLGLFLSAPIWMWQIWAFIMPGLTRKEIKYTLGFLGAALPLFFAGCYVGTLIVPHIIELMATLVLAKRRWSRASVLASPSMTMCRVRALRSVVSTRCVMISSCTTMTFIASVMQVLCSMSWPRRLMMRRR